MQKSVEWYLDFVDSSYKPSKDELIALFYFEPSKSVSVNEAVGRIASESSTGTWTTLFKMPPRMKKLMAHPYSISGNYVKVAYPLDLWEKGNCPQLLSGIGGNIFGMKALDNLRLMDIHFPKSYLKSFSGPRHGMQGIRKMMNVYKRPMLGAVPKPKIGFTDAEHAEIGYETWMGGFDFVKDDENLTSTSFNNFDKRVKLLGKLRDKAEKATGDIKDAYINITAETDEMKRRAKLLHNYGFKHAMIDVVVTGYSGVQTLRKTLGDYGMAIHAHRAMHAMFDRNPKHGMSMYMLAKLMRMIGVDQIHSGTAVGKLVGTSEEVKNISDTLREKKVDEKKNVRLEQDWHGLKQAFPVTSGGLHPGLVPDLMKLFGDECVMLVSGGIHGHPKGTRAGAMATRQAIDAIHEGESLEEHAKYNPELKMALEKWSHLRPV
ncbi:MAG: type III ribulose-bisphosphate carboxylase [Nanoarchaeota archaeon]